MTRFVVGMYRKRRIHVGETEDFKRHIGYDQNTQKPDPQLVVDLAKTWRLYDEEGRRLDAVLNGAGGVDFVARGEDERVKGALLVAEINYIMGIAQSRLDADWAKAVADTATKVNGIVAGNVNKRTEAKKLALSMRRLRDLEKVSPFPSIEAALPVVLAALAELFRYDPEAPPNFLNPDHDWAHRHGMTHR